MKRSKPLNHYLSLNYPYELVRDPDQGGYLASHPDLDGCAAQGESADEAIAELDVARELWIETRLEDGLYVPEPAPEEPSGRVTLRIPSSLHAKLIRVANRQGVSLNLLLTTVLAEYVGDAGFRGELPELLREITSAIARLQGLGHSNESYESAPKPFFIHERPENG